MEDLNMNDIQFILRAVLVYTSSVINDLRPDNEDLWLKGELKQAKGTLNKLNNMQINRLDI
ncbi:hypothetical protein [Tepidanaerobacter syntrophicus]|uniref:Uncharacterized protein n=1 Tax=Tepidanaerobacter syntrophicus TaxID=224999 RepID=A0A0U9HGN9_9FIRM|nr:hypothetical protein [Tepidanaerobacter syntrophicus]GAQ26034.1 hypothetical protein TSYNT_9290 [Tepidanaerobacter syntrophicus]HHV82602.1 hypothetical protein [Tepidanaerobacter syntrophicus]